MHSYNEAAANFRAQTGARCLEDILSPDTLSPTREINGYAMSASRFITWRFESFGVLLYGNMAHIHINEWKNHVLQCAVFVRIADLFQAQAGNFTRPETWPKGKYIRARWSKRGVTLYEYYSDTGKFPAREKGVRITRQELDDFCTLLAPLKGFQQLPGEKP